MFGMLMEVALVSYLVAALTFAVFGVFLFVRHHGQPRRVALGAICAVNALWALLLALPLWAPANWPMAAALLEGARNLAWDLFILLLIGAFGRAGGKGGEGRRTVPHADRWLVLVAAFYGLQLACTLAVSWRYGYPLQLGEFTAMTLLRTTSAILGLFLIEQLYRNTVDAQRWGIKFACLGMGLMFAYDFYLYSDALLFRHFSADTWAARGFVNALAVPLIAISALRNPRWSLGLKVSRHVLFHSAALFGSAAYLLVMASTGYYVRLFGGSWGTVAQLAFLCAALVLLLGALFSGGVRSRLRVFISKHFYRYNYDYREVWLAFTGSLSAKGPDLERRVVEAMARLVESPAGAAFVVRAEGIETVARWNMAVAAQPDAANAELLRYLGEKQWVIDLLQHREHPAHYDHLVLPAWLREVPRGWLVVPLHVQGVLFGFVLLAQSRSPVKLNWEVTDLLKIAGRQAGSFLAQHQVATDLMVARQFESFNRMSTFVVHDLKNLVAQLSLLMANAERHKDNPEFQRDMIDTVDFSVQKMRLLLHKLSRKDSAERNEVIALEPLLQRILHAKAGFGPAARLIVAASGVQVTADVERLERVIGHLVQNALEAVSPVTGQVDVRLDRVGEQALVEIIDNGHGMSEQFIRERLFKPFETTKSAGMGIGVFESREYLHLLGGELQVQSTEGAGTRMGMRLPLHVPAAQAAPQLLEENP